MHVSWSPEVLVFFYWCHSDLDLKAPIFSCLLTLIVDMSLGLFVSSFDSLLVALYFSFSFFVSSSYYLFVSSSCQPNPCAVLAFSFLELIWSKWEKENMGSLGGEIARKKAMWLSPKVIGVSPSERWGHSACYSSGLVYIFGVRMMFNASKPHYFLISLWWLCYIWCSFLCSCMLGFVLSGRNVYLVCFLCFLNHSDNVCHAKLSSVFYLLFVSWFKLF